MLPFLKNKQSGEAGLSIKYRAPDESKQENHSEDEGLRACSRALIKAVTEDSEEGVAKALRDAFTILDAQPHEEGEHTNEEESE